MTEIAPDVIIFTVEKANRALPLVRRIVGDIVAEHPVWRDLMARYELLVAGARPERGESPEMLELRAQIDRIAARISGYQAELEQIGCVLKGFEQGLVDFYGSYEGRLVCLCWQVGEDAVTHWHELEAGFQGRQDITPEFLAGQAEPARAGDR
jgi:hypothetical protein